MLEGDRTFTGSVPENYDRYMVPMVFEGYAGDMARRAVTLAPGAVLETACGTGAVTRMLAPMLPPGARYVATDLNQPMVDFATSRQPPDPPVTWRQADALALPFEDGSFDLVLCQFGAMFFPDKLKGFGEARRTLSPGGHFLFSVWDRIEENSFARDAEQALIKAFPDDPPRFMARVPHGYHDTDAIRATLKEAGFGRVEIETRADVSHAQSARFAALALCQGTPLRGDLEARAPGRLEAITEIVADALESAYGPGEIEGRIQAHVIVAYV